MRDEFLKIFASLYIFVFEGEVDFLEEETQNVQLVLDVSDH